MIRNSIARAVSSLVSRHVNGAKLSFEIVMKKLFANGEQGFFYDPNDLTTMFQDSAGTIPVTAVGQPVGLVLDKSKGLVLGPNVAKSPGIQGIPVGGAAVTNYGVADSLVVGRMYKVSITISGYAGSDTVGLAGSSSDAFISVPVNLRLKEENTTISFFAIAATTYQRLATRSTNTATFEEIQIREVVGSYAYQTTSAARPILRDTQRRIDFDAVDDKLITTLPAQLTGCTVVRSVPNVGTQILTDQTIPATYEDNKDHCGLIVINRALTPSETSAITAEFNKRAGV